MTKMLITGGAGFIGSSLAEKLLENPDNFVVLVDNLLTGSTAKLPSPENGNWKFIKCDVNNYKDIASIMHSHSFDYVFHYAAVVGVQRTLKHPTLVLDDIQGIRNILDLCKNTGVKRVFYASSSEVYGESVSYPQHEVHTPLNSRLPYAVVKNVGEAFCTSYHKEYGLDYTIFRFFNTYGPKQSPDFVVSRFIKAALQGQPITVHGDGEQTRTFCHINDNLGAVLSALYGNRFQNEVVNIGSDNETTILELAQTILKLTGSGSSIKFLPPRTEGDMPRRKPSLERMKVLHPQPLIPLETGLAMLLEQLPSGEMAKNIG